MEFLITKKNNDYYLTGFERPIKLELEVVIYYGLKNNDIIDNLLELLDENEYYQVLNLAYKRLASDYTTYELFNYFKDKGYQEKTIRRVLNELSNKNILNDSKYAKNYVSLKSYKYGPNKLKYDLDLKGINKNIVNDAFKDYDEEKILTHLIKRDKTSTKGSFENFKNRLLNKYINKGFNLYLVSQTIEHILNKDDYDEQKELEKEYLKIYQKESLKEEDIYNLKFKIRLKLIKKGYINENILKVERSFFNE